MTTMDPDPALVARLRAAGCVFAEDEAALLQTEAGSASELETMVVRRVAGDPLELILGWAELCGVRVRVAPSVFVPRQRSALLVRLAVQTLVTDLWAPKSGVSASKTSVTGEVRRVLDLGCGTGALGAAVAAQVPETDVWASDIDPAAVECARLNLLADQVVQGDLFDALPDSLRFDVILANAPYVPTEEIAHMPPEARDHEHRVALDGGPDGLDVQRRVIAAAPRWLRPGGVLLIESSQEQAPTTAALMMRAGLTAEIHHDDELYATAVSGAKTAEGPDEC